MTDKQIPEHYEIAKILADNFTPEIYNDSDFEWCAYQLVQAGYHKDIEGKWIDVPFPNNPHWKPNKKCSVCGRVVRRKTENYCPRCGAVMKGAKQ